MRLSTLFAAAVALAATATAARAQSLDFTFTFISNEGPDTSISGEVFGLTNNATSSASEFLITSATGDGASGLALPINLVPGAGINRITVADGAVTGVDLDGASFDFYTGFDYYFSFEAGAFNMDYFDGNTSQPFWSDGHITFTEIVPEPSSRAVMAVGLAGLACAGSRRRGVRAG